MMRRGLGDGAGGPASWGAGGCPFYSMPYDNTGTSLCDAAGVCAPGGGPGCISVFELYPVYSLAGGLFLIFAVVALTSGRPRRYGR